MPIDSFTNRFQQALNKSNLKQVDICEKTGLSSSLINKYITGKAIPRQNKIYLLAQTLNVNPAWLMGFDVSPAPIPTHIDEKEFEKMENQPLDNKKNMLLDYMNQCNIDSMFPLPVYSIGNTNMSLLGNENITNYIPVNPKIYSMDDPSNYFYIKLWDESMDKKYKKGDYILIKKSSELQKDSIALVIIDNIPFIRKITIQDSLVLLEPMSNNLEFKTQVKASSDIKILGYVIGYMGYEKFSN